MGIESTLIKRQKKCGKCWELYYEDIDKLIQRHTSIMYTYSIHAHTWKHTSGIRDSAIMCYGIKGRYGRMTFLIKTIRRLIALGFKLILRH